MKGKKDWKNRAVRWIALGLVALMLLSVLITIIVSPAMAEGTGKTDLQLTVLEDLGAVSVTQTTQYQNNTGQSADQLIFQLAPNALRRETTAPYESETMIDAYPDGFAAGGVEIHSVKFNGQSADWGVQGTDEATLRVSCSLAPGETGSFQFDYELILPDALGALGTGDIGWRLTGFYPLPAVWDGEYAVERVSPVGESLMADPMDYHVTVNLPGTWQVAAGGSVQVSPAGDARQNVTIDLTKARFFGLALSRRYIETEEKSASGVTVRSFANDRDAAKRAASFAAHAVDIYSDLFGAYPRDSLTIAQADLMDGLSQAGLALLPEGLYAYAARGELEYQTALWTARQWFGEMVGDNPAEEPWLTESLASYAALLYYEKAYGHDRYLKELNARVTPSLRLTIPGVRLPGGYARARLGGTARTARRAGRRGALWRAETVRQRERRKEDDPGGLLQGAEPSGGQGRGRPSDRTAQGHRRVRGAGHGVVRVIGNGNLLRSFSLHGDGPVSSNVCGRLRAETGSGMLSPKREASGGKPNPPRMSLDLFES